MDLERAPRRASALFVLGLLLAPLALPQGAHASHELPPRTMALPLGLSSVAAVWDGSAVLSFGGDRGASGETNRAFRIDPVAGQVNELPPMPGYAVTFAAAVWDPRDRPLVGCPGGCAYVFGGYGANDHQTAVMRFNPRTGVYTVVANTPQRLSGHSAVWDGQYAYLVSGRNSAGYTSDIFRYDPVTGGFLTYAAVLPKASAYGAAALLGGFIYVFGGQSQQPHESIFRFDPATGAVKTMGAVFTDGNGLLSTRTALTAATDGRYAYLYGGSGLQDGLSNVKFDHILRYDPVLDRLERLPATLPTGRVQVRAVSAGTYAVLVGGQDDVTVYADVQIHRLSDHVPVARIAPLPPSECLAGRAEVTLDGSASSDADGTPLTFAWSASGIALDNPGSATARGSFPLGDTMASLRVADANFSAEANATVVVHDTQPPTVAITEQGTRGNSGWWRSPVRVTYDAQDACGLAYVGYLIDDIAELPYTGPFDVVGDGVRQHRTYLDDVSGLEYNRLGAIAIDTASPDLAVLDPSTAALYVGGRRIALGGTFPGLPATLPVASPPPIVVGDVVVRAQATDATSGIDHVDFAIDGAAPIRDDAPPFELNWPASRTSLGTHRLDITAYDVAGNRRAAVVFPFVVPTAPEGLAATGDSGTACRQVLVDKHSRGLLDPFGPEGLVRLVLEVLPNLETVCRDNFNPAICEQTVGPLYP